VYQYILIAGVIYLLYRLACKVMGRDLGVLAPARSRFQCETCCNCGKVFSDGVMCQFQGRETFKNETHISNCLDYQKK
jgi:hypothetical protein